MLFEKKASGAANGPGGQQERQGKPLRKSINPGASPKDLGSRPMPAAQDERQTVPENAPRVGRLAQKDRSTAKRQRNAYRGIYAAYLSCNELLRPLLSPTTIVSKRRPNFKKSDYETLRCLVRAPGRFKDIFYGSN